MKVVRQSPILGPDGKSIQHVTVIHNRYEASYVSGSRSFLNGFVQSADKDNDYWSRYEISRRARYLYKNSPVTRGVIKWLVTYSVGDGIKPIPSTSNPGWNDLARSVFDQWAKRADLTTRNSFWELQRIIAAAVFLDGDIGTYLTRSAENRPRVQLIEHQKITGDDVRGRNAMLRDGVQTDASGRPLYYYVQTADERAPVAVPERLFILHYIADRANQHRGISSLHAAINTIQDLEEICALEKQAVKIHASQEGVIELAEGFEADDVFRDDEHSTEGTSWIDCDAKERLYKEILGTETKILKPGDKYNPLTSDRPSPAWQGFVSHLLDSISLSLGVPPSVILNQKKGGADTRRDLAAAARAFSAIQQTLSSQFQRIYEYVIESEHARGNIRQLPADWKNVTWHYPRSITVDHGRDSKADVENVKIGLDTFKNLYGEYGLDWQEQLEQRAIEEKFVAELAAKYGLRPEDIVMKTAKQMEDLNNAGNKE